ncbi:MAG: SDR family oxidoreductase [Microbacterium sp.]|jgi:NAD(P)-dependent dehydrogenase (short-subunit alcohol dehydrogenase family)|uniref:SDR family NAD(P)-dependent oxidoreductase n=1 Tax=Microbacterium sp. TaxID=51671 RepID=UPI002816C945|nr:SDR family oxidoreductase [Microbacterium sp.]MDR2323230.1 SDR family oxidoreductase [Microbacterium sp.]
MTVAGRTVLLAGATSPSGLAIARALIGAGARVVAVGRDRGKLDALAAAAHPAVDASADARSGSIRVESCSLTNESEVAALATRLAEDGEHIDGLVPLVGGWRGGGGLAGQTEEDYRALEQAFTAVRVTSRAFDADLRASEAGRFAIISSTAVARPLAGGANYAAVKAASEAWTRAVAQGFAKAARDAEQPLRAAAVVLRVRGLDDAIDRVAAQLVELWDTDAAELNDRVIDLT